MEAARGCLLGRRSGSLTTRGEVVASWECPCKQTYRIRAEIGRPVFSVRRGNWELDVVTCVRCRRNLRKTRAAEQAGRQMELTA